MVKLRNNHYSNVIDFTEQADSIFDFKVKMTSVFDNALLLIFASEATIRG